MSRDPRAESRDKARKQKLRLRQLFLEISAESRLFNPKRSLELLGTDFTDLHCFFAENPC